MIEANLLSALEAANIGDGIVFQVSHTQEAIVVVANRPDSQPLDYVHLKAKIVEIAQKFDLTQISSLYLYSRILGEEAPDWQEKITFTKPILQKQEAPPSSVVVDKSQEAIAKIQTKPKAIHEYRFGISDYLIGTIAEPPEPEVAEIIIFFHELSEDERAQILPALEQIFVNRDNDAFKGHSEKYSDWLQKIEGLSKLKRRSVSIWLARYCVKGEEILGAVTGSLPKHPEIHPTTVTSDQAPPEDEKASEPVDSSLSQRTTKNIGISRNAGGSGTTLSGNNSGASAKATSPATRTASVQSVDLNANIKPMAIVLVIIGVLIGWLFSGLLKLTPLIATIGFIHGFLWALGVSYGNQLFLGSTVFNIVILIFFRGYFMSQGVGILAGLATAGGIKISARSPQAGSKFFNPRGYTATGSTLFGVILGIFLLGGGIGNQNPNVASSGTVAGEISVVDQKIFFLPDTLPKGQVSVQVANKSSVSCQLLLRTEPEFTEPISGNTEPGIPLVTKLALLNSNSSSEVLLSLTPGGYSLYCEENLNGKGSFVVEP